MSDPIVVSTAVSGDRLLKIYVDQSPSDPREINTPMGTMVIWRGGLGDKTEFTDRETFWGDLYTKETGTYEDEEQFADEAGRFDEDKWKSAVEAWVRENVIALELYIYEHGGVTMRYGKLGDIWDPADGYMFCTMATGRYEYSGDPDDAVREKVIKYMKGELDEYICYMEGDVYGYNVFRLETCPHCGHTKEELLDSCWGFYGRDFEQNGLAENLGDDKDLLDVREDA